MSYSFALLPIPRAAWDFIADAMESSGYGDHMITTDIRGNPTVALNMHGIGLIPAGDQSDQFINAGNLSDLLVGAGEEAFRAGFEYAKAHPEKTNYQSGWDHYEVSDEIHELLDNL